MIFLENVVILESKKYFLIVIRVKYTFCAAFGTVIAVQALDAPQWCIHLFFKLFKSNYTKY